MYFNNQMLLSIYNTLYTIYILVLTGLYMRPEFEIMRFVQGKLCVKNIELRAKLCAKIHKNSHLSFILRSFRCLSSLKRLGTNKTKVLSYFCTNFNRFRYT